MLARWWAWAVWAAVAGSAVFWGLRLFVQPPAAPSQTVVAAIGAPPAADLTRLLGADPPPPPPEPAAAEPPPDARFQLLGVVSPVGGVREGVALIAVDGQAPKAYPVGATVTDGLQLQSVRQRGVSLGPRGQPASVRLELPALPPPATGSLPPAGGGDTGGAGFAGAAGVGGGAAPYGTVPAYGAGPSTARVTGASRHSPGRPSPGPVDVPPPTPATDASADNTR